LGSNSKIFFQINGDPALTWGIQGQIEVKRHKDITNFV